MTHIIIITKSAVATFPFLSYFSVVVRLRWLCRHNLSSVTYISREYFISSIDVQSIVFANDRLHYGLRVGSVCLYITLSSIIIMQAYLKTWNF